MQKWNIVKYNLTVNQIQEVKGKKTVKTKFPLMTMIWL